MIAPSTTVRQPHLGAKALSALGAEFMTPATPAELNGARAVIVPGVGHFATTRALDDEWRDAIGGVARAGTPLFGICVGMQWLFEGSDEAPGVAGLGVIKGQIARLPNADTAQGPARRLERSEATLQARCFADRSGAQVYLRFVRGPVTGVLAAHSADTFAAAVGATTSTAAVSPGKSSTRAASCATFRDRARERRRELTSASCLPRLRDGQSSRASSGSCHAAIPASGSRYNVEGNREVVSSYPAPCKSAMALAPRSSRRPVDLPSPARRRHPIRVDAAAAIDARRQCQPEHGSLRTPE